ncbi:hypothetical protein ABT124_15670 [Streptomyces sp. NPDC001982]|uniref:hypothetical protein n=1 Tax=Streptomyces sp. NPDC001982 TaxID=3154405 RepID=UPI003328F48A
MTEVVGTHTHDTPAEPLAAHYFVPPIRRGHGDFVRIEPDTGRVSGYLRATDGTAGQ